MSQDTLGLQDYLAALKRRALLALAIALPIFLVGVALALTLPDVYRSTARFQLISGQIAETGIDKREYADQYVFSLAEKVLSQKNLQAILNDAGPMPGFEGGEDEAIAKLRGGVAVNMSTQSVLDGGRERTINTGFSVSYNSDTPAYAKKVADGLAKFFVEMGRSDQLAGASERVAFFAGEAERINRDIADFEGRLADFKSKNFDRLPETMQTTLSTRTRIDQEMQTIARELRNLQQNRVFVEQQLRQAQAATATANVQQLEAEYARKAALYAETHPDVIALRRQIDNLRRGGPVLVENSLQAQLESERAILAEARQRYSDDHPDVRRLLSSIASLEARIAAGEDASAASANQTTVTVQLQTQLNAMETQITGLRSRSETLQNQLARLEAQLGATPEVEREYLAITRGLDSARDQYDQMITRRMEAEVALAAINAGSADRFVLVGHPSTPWEPSGPPRLGIVFVALVLCGMIALSTVILAELCDSKLRGVRDVRVALGMSPLAVVPRIKASEKRRDRSARRRRTSQPASAS